METLKNQNDVIHLYDDLFQAEQWDVIEAEEILAGFKDCISKVYVIRKGVLGIRINYHQKALCLGYFVPGDVIGMLGAEYCSFFPYEIKAVTKTEVYAIDRTRMEEVVRLVSAIDDHLKKQRALWVSNTLNRLKTMAFYTPYQRVAAWVLDYFNYKKYHSNEIWRFLNTAEMAAYCNISTSEFKEIMISLNQQEIINTTKNNCTLLDKCRLEEIIKSVG